jgi:hypothetical protein
MKVRCLLIGVTFLFVGLLTTSSYAAINPATCIGMWLFDEGSGTITKDYSGSKNNGTLMNHTKWVDGKFSKALEFDGVDDCVAFVSQPSSLANGFTFSAWVKRNADTPGCQAVFNNNQFFLRTQPEGENADNPFEVFVLLNDGSVEPRAGSAVPSSLGQWLFVVVTWDKTTLNIYVDGVFKGSSVRTGNITPTTATAQIGQGQMGSTTDNSFNGIIDEAAIFNVPLVVEDIQTIMNQGLKQSLGLVTAVDLSGKLTTTWAGVKAR